MGKLTKRQNEVLMAIVQYLEKHHYPPTMKEIGKMLNISSTSTIFAHLEKLRRAGYITWEFGKPRTLRVLKLEGIN
jgi:SOS-response transcriptional repressor LexA